MPAENLNHLQNNKDLKGMKDMRIKYFGENKERGWGRVAIIRFTDDEFDLYKYIENYEHTYGDSSRMFACGGLVGVERNEKGVWINESYISVDDFSDFNDFKANYKEAKKEFKSLKKQVTETKPETATNSETTEAEETTDPEVGKFVYDVRIHNDYGWGTYTVRADGLESAEYKAVRRMELETDEEEYSSIDVIRIYKEDSNELLKEIISKEREDPETADQGETAEKKMDDVLFETLIRNAKAFPPCDFPGATKLLNICQQMNKTQLSDFCKILIEKGIFTYEYGQIVTTKGRLLICPVSDMARGA